VLRARAQAVTTLLIAGSLTPALLAIGAIPAEADRAPPPAASARGAAAPGSRPAASAVTAPGGVGTGADDNPIGLTFETLSGAPDGAIRIDGVPAPGTAIGGTLDYAVISRTDRCVVTAGQCFLTSGHVDRSPGGIADLIEKAKPYAKNDHSLMVVSGTLGIFTGALDNFKTLAKLLGVSADDLSKDVTDALTSQQAPFSLIGIPGAASGTAWLNVGLVQLDQSPTPPFRLPPKGDILGRLQWNINTARYDFVDEQFPEFNTYVRRAGAEPDTMDFNGRSYRAGDTAGTSGFHVLVADSVNLRVLANQTLPTNGGTTPVATLQESFARQLAADARMPGFQQFYADKAPPLILLQSYGHPSGAAQAWQDAANTIAELGGNRLAFLALDDSSASFALVGRLGGQAYTALASSYTGQPGPLAGVLTRTQTMAFEPMAAGPARGINSQMIILAYQPPKPFTPFTGGEQAAAGWIAVKLGLCDVAADCNVRKSYWSLYGAVTWVNKAGQLLDLTYPSGEGFTQEEFNAVRKTLHAEFGEVENVKHYFADLASVFTAVKSESYVNIKDIGDAVFEAVRPPSVERTVSLLTWISRIVLLGQVFGPPVSPAFAGLSAAFSLGAYWVSQSGASALPAMVRAKTNELARVLSGDLTAAADNFSVIGRLIASDAGKLTRFQSLYTTPDWKLDPSLRPAKDAISRAAQQWFATQLVPAGFPWLGIAWGATPNDLSCWYYKTVRRPVKIHNTPWLHEPALAQLRTVVAFADGRPVTQSVFFGTAFNEQSKDNNPPDSLAKFLFEPAAGTGEALLDLRSFLSDANFGKSHRATNDESCPAPRGPAEQTRG
jgi:hypothetical protein